MFPTKINLLSKKSKSEQMLEGQHLFDPGKCTVTKNKTTSIHRLQGIRSTWMNGLARRPTATTTIAAAAVTVESRFTTDLSLRTKEKEYSNRTNDTFFLLSLPYFVSRDRAD